MLPQEFKNAVIKYIKEDYLPFLERSLNDEKSRKRAKSLVKFEHDYDFFIGQALGFLVGQNNQLFKELYNKDMTFDEAFELDETIMLELQPIKKIIKQYT